jgi:anthranilate synthase component 2
VIMGLSHRRYPVHGLQFHPESFLTAHGHALAENFLRLEMRLGEGARGSSTGVSPVDLSSSSPNLLPQSLTRV